MDSQCIVDENCTIPKTEDDITEEWIRNNVGVAPLPKSVSVEGNIQDGVGFLSNLCRVSFQTDGGVSRNIVVKLLPVNPEFRAITLSSKFDEREIKFYSIVKPKIVGEVKSLNDNLCKFYCGKMSKIPSGDVDEDYASMLIMEDLKPSGYQMLNPNSDLWSENLERVMKFLAQFHCASLALEKRGSKIPELFPFCMGIGETTLASPLVMEMARNSVPRLDPFLEENKGSPALREAYKYITDQVVEYFELVLKEGSKNCCLIHGDLWPPNIMLVEGKESPVKIIDWQLLGYKDPTYELPITILTCLPKSQLKRETLDKFCKLYMDTCEALGFDLGRSRAEFQECFDTWGMIYAFYWFFLSFDCFPNDMEKVFLILELFQSEYKITEFLKSRCSKG